VTTRTTLPRPEGPRRPLRRIALLGVAMAVGLALSGDRALTQVTAPAGIDPLEAFEALTKNNVLVVFDTSEAMRSPVDAEHLPVGDDDIESRFHQAKVALSSAVNANSDRLSFGMVTFGPDSSYVNGNGVDGASNQAANPGAPYDGPFVYVSFDSAASAFYGTAPSFCSATSHTLARFFCGPGNTFASYDGNSSGDIYLSLSNSSGTGATTDNRFADPYPRGCSGTDCRYYIQSRLLRNDVLITVNPSPTSAADAVVSISNSACGTPPSGVFAETEPDRACFKVTNGTSTATFWYVSTAFASGTTSTCDPLSEVAGVPDCSAASGAATVADISDALEVAVPVNQIASYALGASAAGGTNDAGGDTIAEFGVRTKSGAGRPIAGVLDDIADGTVSFPSQQQPDDQKNFVLLVTTGSDFACADADPDQSHKVAVEAAEDLWGSGADGSTNAELLVVGFTNDALTVNRLNELARTGSGGARDAFIARTKEEIEVRIRQALEIAAGTGEFATAPSTVATVYEYGGNASKPSDRYDERSNIIYQPTVEMPGWKGHLYAFVNDSSGALVADPLNGSGNWDAGEKLYETTVKPMITSGTKERYTFEELHAGATARGVRTSSAALKRRVFTSSPSAGSGGSAYNRAFTRSSEVQYDAADTAGSNVVALWPPNQTGLTSGVSDVDPAMGTTGPLDVAMGLTTLSLDQLQALGACRGSAEAGSGTVPAECSSDETDMTRKEARQILLAWAGGAQVAVSTEDGLPLRDGTSGELLFEARDWLLGDTTLAQAAVVSPPLGPTPDNYGKEWVLFRDGRRGSDLQGIPEVSKGFGLREPDADDGDPENDVSNKPVMTVIYAAHNDGLHAFRAGQNCPDAIAACTETGGEELWKFVPIDQLHKLYYLALGQSHSDHVYVTSASVRVADIFIPGSFALGGQTYSGRWRTVLYFGRGPGGKFLTALDVTGPGMYTDEALDTNPPWVMWNRGNEDSRVPAPTGADAGFDGMGETWSVPAVGRSEILGTEYVVWAGSGYGDVAGEGQTLFGLAAIDGSILFSNNVGSGTTTYISRNALVASPAAYNEFYLKPPSELNSAVIDRVTRVYVPDLHGRIWRFDSTSGRLVANLGPRHPMADSLALMLLDIPSADQTWLFGGTGRDTRVPYDSSNPFEIFGFRDTSTAATPVTYTSLPLDQNVSTAASNTGGFRRSLRDGSGLLYRNAAQPAAAFNDQGNGRVFFVGSRYAGIAADCVSSFGSILFGLGAASGGAAYDFSGDGAVDFSTVLAPGTRVTGVTTQGGGVFVSASNLTTPVPPTPSMGAQNPTTPEAPTVTVTNVRANTAVCRTY
jgi:hypothetical protein